MKKDRCTEITPEIPTAASYSNGAFDTCILPFVSDNPNNMPYDSPNGLLAVPLFPVVLSLLPPPVTTFLPP